MAKRKIYRPNIVRGGAAIPLGNNYYYMAGRSHERGGIDVGKSLEVEGGEVMHVSGNEAKVFSAQPFLNGESPAQRVMNGENPTKIFNAQERYKDVHKINDDGTKKKARGGTAHVSNNRKVIDETYREQYGRYPTDAEARRYAMFVKTENKKMGGLSRDKDYGSSKKPYPNVKSSDFAGGGRSYPIPTKADARDALRLAGLHHRNDVKAKVYAKYPDLKKKAKTGGLYELSINGRSSLHPFPSTGSVQRSKSTKSAKMKYGGRKRAEWGMTDNGVLDTVTDLIPFVGTAKDITRAVKNPTIGNMAVAALSAIGDVGTAASFGLGAPLVAALKGAGKRTASSLIKRGIIQEGENLTKQESRRRAQQYVRQSWNPLNQPTVKRKVAQGVNKADDIATVLGNVRTWFYPDEDDYRKAAHQNETEQRLGGRKKFVGGGDDDTKKDDDTTTTTATTTDTDENENTDNRNFWQRTKDYARQNAGDVADYIGLASNIGLSLIGNRANNRMLNRMRYASQPIAQQAAKLKTTININPQLAKMRESLSQYERSIRNNTASSRVALARQQQARLANILGVNELYANKENQETSLINTDRLNQQQVAGANIQAYNQWAQGLADFRNSILEKRADNNVSLLNNINAGIQNTITNFQQRRSDARTLRALTLASPNLPAEMYLASRIWTKEDYDMYRKAHPLTK